MKKNLVYAIAIWALFMQMACKSRPVNFEGGSPPLADMKSRDVGAPAPTSMEMAQEERLATQAPSVTEPNVTVTRKIIKDGRMEIRVKEIEKGKVETDSLVKKYHGYYADETFNNLDYAHGYQLKIRIPSVNFEVFIAAIEAGAGEVAFKNITSRDVTEEFIDLETRLNNKRKYLARYGDLLKQAKTVKDILEIQEKSRLIEEEVESVQGRLKYLTNQVDFSTLDLQISKKNDYNLVTNNKGSFIDRLKLSLVKGWFGLVSFTLFVIRVWPFWIIMGVLFYLVRRIWKRKKK